MAISESFHRTEVTIVRVSLEREPLCEVVVIDLYSAGSQRIKRDFFMSN